MKSFWPFITQAGLNLTSLLFLFCIIMVYLLFSMGKFYHNFGYVALSKVIISRSNLAIIDKKTSFQKAENFFILGEQLGTATRGRAYFLMGITYQKQRDYENAFRVYHAATDLEFIPTDWKGETQLYYELGWLYDHYLADRRAAEDAYKMASKIADVPYNKGEIGNLLKNGGFEYPGLYWGLSSPSGAKTFFDDIDARSGSQSLQVHFDGTQDLNYYHAVTFLPVEFCTAYNLTVYIKTLNLDNGGIAVEVYDAERGYEHWSGGSTNLLSGTNDWTKTTLNFVSGVDTNTLKVVIRRFGKSGQLASGTIWVDDLQLIKR